MGAIVLKYVQLICVAFFVKNTNCAHIMDSEETSHLKIAACVVECMSVKGAKLLEACYHECIEESTDRALNYEAPDAGTGFHLYCRDAQKLIIQIDHDDAAGRHGETFLYMLKVKESTGKFTDRIYLFSDEKLINATVADLSVAETTTLSYDITAYIISSVNATVWKLDRQKFTTLMPDYKPEEVTHISAHNWTEYYDENEQERLLNFTFTWQPERSHTCSYEVLFYGDDLDLDHYPVSMERLFEYTMTGLKYDMEYSVAIRAINSYDTTIHSRDVWRKFQSLEGETPLDVAATMRHVEDYFFDVNVTWSEPKDSPDFYQVEVKNLHSSSQRGIYVARVNGSATFHVFRHIELTSSTLLINITGYAENGNVYSHDFVFEDRPVIHQSRLINILFYVFVALVAVLLLFLFKVWKGRIDSFISTFAQKRIDDMDIEIVKTITTGTVLDAIAELTKDARMEVERENITVLQLIGEGAFGLVKKGLIIRNGEKEYVAVKMIKNTSNLEDIRQFHQEISVMKSVGQHENIVSIVGHCTSDIKELMLLTEYCDDGSLLDLLRLEFAKQLKFYDTKGKLNASVQITMEKYPDSLLNFDMSDGDKKDISYKNLGCSATAAALHHNKLFVVNQMYDELNNNVKNEALLKAIEMTATNALYLKLNDHDSQAKAQVVDDEDFAGEFLTSGDLLSYAKQICDGMDFLARKKVVHRDLAARNILVCSNKTVKISDFGLSRDIYQDLVYKKTGNGKLPIKWLALESMTHQVYTSQSDVWSFGVLLYEIVTLGAVPYSSINVENLLKFLRAGFRLERPSHCHILLYELMTLCWHANPLDRPAFDELSTKLHNFLLMENSWGERIIDLSKMFNKCMSDVNYMKPLI